MGLIFIPAWFNLMHMYWHSSTPDVVLMSQWLAFLWRVLWSDISVTEPWFDFMNQMQFLPCNDFVSWITHWHFRVGAEEVNQTPSIRYSATLKNEIVMRNTVFWDVAPCRSCVNRRFGRTYRLHLQGTKIRERGTSVSRWLQSAVTSVKTSGLI
jgi:hypothetical protein